MSDTEAMLRILVARAALGDEEAFATLVHQFTRRLAWFIRKMGVAPSAVEDVLQNTWLTVWQSLTRLRDKKCFKAWLYGIARNKARQHAHAVRDIATPMDEVAQMVEEENDDLFHDLYLPHLSPALEKLSLAHREVLLLRFLENMPYEEIAQTLDVSLGTTKSRLHNAKAALKKQLEAMTHE